MGSLSCEVLGFDRDLVTGASAEPDGSWPTFFEDLGRVPVLWGDPLRFAGDFGWVGVVAVAFFGVFGFLKESYSSYLRRLTSNERQDMSPKSTYSASSRTH